MTYFWIKCIHILAASLTFGFTLAYCLYAHHIFHHNPKQRYTTMQVTHKLAYFITMPAGCLQMLSGFTLISLHQYNLRNPWLYIPVVCFFLAAFCWIIALFHHQQCQMALTQNNTQHVHRHYKIECRYACAAGLLMILAVFFMANCSHFI